MQDWWIYRGKGTPKNQIGNLPEPPPWRRFSEEEKKERGERFKPNNDHEIEMINAALYLRRPLLVTGKPGVGKTSLAYSVAYELGLGEVLRWSVTTRATLQEGLYRYDAIARLQDASLQKREETLKVSNPFDEETNEPDIGKYLRLGPLGTAFAAPSKIKGTDKKAPRVLLIDEIDKSDIDLPNDLLHIFEEGEFEIPELARLPDEEIYRRIAIAPHDKGDKVQIERGKVRCEVFPLVIMTSNGEREFPPAFLRRCLRLEMELPDEDQLAEIVNIHLKTADEDIVKKLIERFLEKQKTEELSTDQLLNVVYLAMNNIDKLHRDKDELLEALWKSLSGML